jgi:phenylglyoxylate dehydrogenase epsilon subunit
LLKRKHLIIGCGSAGLSAAEEIRRLGNDDDIKIVSRESHFPYSPTALPFLLSGRTEESKIALRDPDYFDRLGVTFVPDREVVSISPQKKMVAYRAGEMEDYDTLLIATGAEPTKPDKKGLDEVGYLPFHTLDDLRALKAQLSDKKDVTVYGGGLVAVELAIALAEAGYRPRIVVRSRILRRYFDEKAESVIRPIFERNGIDVVSGTDVAGLRKTDGTVHVELTNGESLETQVFVSCTGVRARSALAEGSGCWTNAGLLVDNGMATNMPDVYAAGDVAEAPDLLSGEYGLNQIILSAVAQGRVAGSNMAGTEATYEGWVSSNVFHFFGNTAFSAGLAAPPDADCQVLCHCDVEKSQYKRMIFKDGTLMGAMLLNVDVNPGVLLYLIERRVEVGEHIDLLFEQPKDTSRWLMIAREDSEAQSIRA